jgi:hypothetical protein
MVLIPTVGQHFLRSAIDYYKDCYNAVLNGPIGFVNSVKTAYIICGSDDTKYNIVISHRKCDK